MNTAESKSAEYVFDSWLLFCMSHRAIDAKSVTLSPNGERISRTRSRDIVRDIMLGFRYRMKNELRP